MSTINKAINILIFATLSGALSACGGQAYQTSTPPPNPNLGINQNLPNLNPQNDNNEEDTGDTTPTYLPPTINKTVKLQASTSTAGCSTPTPSGVSVGQYAINDVYTDSILKLTISAKAPMNIPCSGAPAYYSCLQVTVAVGDYSEDVMVSYGSPKAGPCAGVPNSKTIDLSRLTTPGRRTPYRIVVSQPQMDNCHDFCGYATEDNNVLGNMSPNFAPSCYPYYGTSGWVAAGYGVRKGGCQMRDSYQNFISQVQVGIQTNTAN